MLVTGIICPFIGYNFKMITDSQFTDKSHFLNLQLTRVQIHEILVRLTISPTNLKNNKNAGKKKNET